LLLEKTPRARVIAFSGFSNASAVEAMWRAGASGFVLKQSGLTELTAAAQAVCAGGYFFSALIDNALPLRRLASGLPQPDSLTEPALSVREQRIVSLLASGLRNKEVAAELDLTVRTVEKYRETVMQKLRMRSFASLVKFAVRRGLTSLHAEDAPQSASASDTQ
jgi:DNA-binding NarL/FixJ family response regulator